MSKKSIIKKQKVKRKAKKQNALKKIEKAEETPILSRDFISLKTPTSSGKGKIPFTINDSESNSDIPTSLRYNKTNKRQQMQAELTQEIASKVEAKKNMNEKDISQEKNISKSEQKMEENSSVDTGMKKKKKQKGQRNDSLKQDEPEKQTSKHHLEESFDSEEPPKKKSKKKKLGGGEKTETCVDQKADGVKDSAEETNSSIKESQKKKKEKPESHYTIFVGNLSYSTTKEDVEQFFSKKVPVLKSVRLPTVKATGKPRGIAFIEVDGEANYQAALSLDKSFMKDRRINVEYTCAGSKKGKHRKGKITAKNLKFKDLKRRGIMTPGVRPPPTKYKFKPLKK